MIVVLSFEVDPHVTLVTRHLDSWSEPWMLVPVDQAGAGTTASASLTDHARSATLRVGAVEVDVAEIRAIWNRRWLRPRSEDYRGDREMQHYVSEQWWHAIDGCLRLADARWINPAAGLEAARSKPRQISDANDLGLCTPPTLVSADLDEVSQFARSLGLDRLVTKVVSPGTPIVPDGSTQYMVFTQQVLLSELDHRAVAAAPAVYQPRLEKAYEVRATVVENDILGCKIDSMASDRTALDWRHYDFDKVDHTPIDIPGRIGDRLIALCRSYGLVFAAADFVVTPDGEWVFLELNPNGQWAWIEEHAGLPIGERLARALTLST